MAMPAVSGLIQTILGAIPAIVEISTQFAKVADAALRMIGTLWSIVTLGGLLNEEVGFVVATMLSLLTVIGLLVKALGPFITLWRILSLEAIKSFTLAIGAAIKQLLLFSGAALKGAVTSLYSFMLSLVQSSTALGTFTIAGYSAASALAAFMTLATLGVAAAVLVPMALSAASAFASLGDDIDSATNSLKEFDRVSGRTEGGFNPYDGGDPPSSGAGAATPGSGGGTTINIESSGDPDDDASNARYVSFRQGRTTGSGN
jgi:hypothetical protein